MHELVWSAAGGQVLRELDMDFLRQTENQFGYKVSALMI